MPSFKFFSNNLMSSVPQIKLYGPQVARKALNSLDFNNPKFVIGAGVGLALLAMSGVLETAIISEFAINVGMAVLTYAMNKRQMKDEANHADQAYLAPSP